MFKGSYGIFRGE